MFLYKKAPFTHGSGPLPFGPYRDLRSLLEGNRIFFLFYFIFLYIFFVSSQKLGISYLIIAEEKIPKAKEQFLL